MPIIKPRTTHKHLVRHITRLFSENNETLHAYAHFIGEPAEYVLNQLIDTILTKDREYQQWRTEHPESFVTTPAATSDKPARRPGRPPRRPAVADSTNVARPSSAM